MNNISDPFTRPNADGTVNSISLVKSHLPAYSVVEQLICNQQVIGSTPIAGSSFFR